MPDSRIIEPTLVVDIGNSNIVCAVFIGGEIVSRCRIENTLQFSMEDYHSRLGDLLPDYPFVFFKRIVIGSVVPAIGTIWLALCESYSSAIVYNINGLSPLGLSYKIKNPAVVGADLVANAFGAWQNYQTSTIVIDLGTATTIQLISAQGLYAGVAIAPGIKTSATLLFSKAAQLNVIELESPGETLGNNTQDALNSGIVLGHALMLKGFVQEIHDNYPEYAPYQVILTGGLAQMIAPLCPADYILDNDLTIKGFYQAACRLEHAE